MPEPTLPTHARLLSYSSEPPDRLILTLRTSHETQAERPHPDAAGDLQFDGVETLDEIARRLDAVEPLEAEASWLGEIESFVELAHPDETPEKHPPHHDENNSHPATLTLSPTSASTPTPASASASTLSPTSVPDPATRRQFEIGFSNGVTLTLQCRKVEFRPHPAPPVETTKEFVLVPCEDGYRVGPPGKPTGARMRIESLAVGGANYRVLAVEDLVDFSARMPPGTEAPYWAVVWEAAVALGEWFHDHPETCRRRNTLELGCGMGLPGVVATALGATVTQTDKIPLALQTAREAFRLNGLPPPAQFVADWHQWDHTKTYNVVFGSDLVYCSSVVPLLPPIFRRQCAPDGSLVLAAPRHRAPAWELIDELANDGWTFDSETRRVASGHRSAHVVVWHGQRHNPQKITT